MRSPSLGRAVARAATCTFVSACASARSIALAINLAINLAITLAIAQAITLAVAGVAASPVAAQSVTRAEPAAPGVTSAPTPAPRVYLLTMGPGDAVWERFGHNAIVIREAGSATATAWNWGVFDFAAPDFLPRFLTGETRYWMAPDDFGATLERYRWLNRSLALQELSLTDDEARALASAVAANHAGESRFYRYDYFLDNCSTRVRDMLDRAVGGALRAQLAAQPAGTTFRRETMRLLGGMPAAAVGVDVALGRRADAPLSRWEAAFVPMRLRDALRTVRVPDGAGGMRPLVRADEPLFTAMRPPEALVPPRTALWLAPLGLALAALLVLCAAPGAPLVARIGAAGVAAAWSLAAGAVGVVLLLAATTTRHVFWGANANLLLFSPLSLVLAVAAPLALLRGRAARLAAGTALGVLAAAVVGAASAFVAGQPVAAPLAFAMPVHAALVVALRRASAARP